MALDVISWDEEAPSRRIGSLLGFKFKFLGQQGVDTVSCDDSRFISEMPTRRHYSVISVQSFFNSPEVKRTDDGGKSRTEIDAIKPCEIDQRPTASSVPGVPSRALLTSAILWLLLLRGTNYPPEAVPPERQSPQERSSLQDVIPASFMGTQARRSGAYGKIGRHAGRLCRTHRAEDPEDGTHADMAQHVHAERERLLSWSALALAGGYLAM